MLLSADTRIFSSDDDRFSHCACCGRDLVVLPSDRRGGYCFDCLSLMGPSSGTCPTCGIWIEGDIRYARCWRCGWTSHHAD